MMRAVGYGDDDFKQPLVGVAHAWIEIMPCNFNHREQAEWVKEGIREAGGTPVEMNTIAISDGIAMGTEGMKASLVSREVVADSIELVTVACPGAGACGGQFTANTMATAFEALGISPAGSSRVPAIDKHRRRDVMKAAGKRAVEMLKEDFRPSRVLKRENFDNAIAAVMATGGSTNAVLHLLACAREAGTPLALQDFDDISARTPLLADLKPWGRFTAVDMDRAGGIMLVLQRLAEAKVLNEHAMTVTGKMIGDEARAAKETHGQEVVRPLANPIAKSGGMMILKGPLAPDGAVMKVAGPRMKPSRLSTR